MNWSIKCSNLSWNIGNVSFLLNLYLPFTENKTFTLATNVLPILSEFALYSFNMGVFFKIQLSSFIREISCQNFPYKFLFLHLKGLSHRVSAKKLCILWLLPLMCPFFKNQSDFL